MLSSAVYSAEKNKILKVEVKKIGAFAEITITTSLNTRPEVLILDSPNRIAMVFHDSVIDTPITIPGPSSLIEMIQTAQFDENTVYVLVQPKEELNYEWTSLVGRNKYILEVSKARPGSTKKITPSVIQKTDIASMPDFTEEISSSATKEVITTEEAATLAVKEEALYIKEIGPTVEAIVASEIKPLRSKLKVVKKSKKLIENIVISEGAAKKPSLITREVETLMIEKVSIESLVTPEISATKKILAGTQKSLPLKGYTVFIDPGHGGRDPGFIGRSGILEKNLTLRIAIRLKKLLNDSGAKVVMTRYDDVEVKNRDIVSMVNSSGADLFVAIHLNSFTSSKIGGCETYYFTPISSKFAKVMQKNISNTSKFKDRGIKKVTYYVVHHVTMPAILVEAGYLTNPKEEKLIRTGNFRQQIALGICKGIKEYVKIAPKWQK